VITVVVLGTVWTLNQNQLISIPFISPEVTESKAVPANQPSVHHYDTVLKKQTATHDHDHQDENANALPPELEEYIESRRKPASEIRVVNHGDGTATAYPEDQWSTVMMMVIDEDGSSRMVERQITPKGTLVIQK
tara:strand:- start:1374 stop:1778 length:405 start_codon:yes stop_codon:yes gene_type:complete